MFTSPSGTINKQGRSPSLHRARCDCVAGWLDGAPRALVLPGWARWQRGVRVFALTPGDSSNSRGNVTCPEDTVSSRMKAIGKQQHTWRRNEAMDCWRFKQGVGESSCLHRLDVCLLLFFFKLTNTPTPRAMQRHRQLLALFLVALNTSCPCR